jgi:D-alanyl-lipoteichoic acid acyltransferase DltB (MBOAT superfamily)
MLFPTIEFAVFFAVVFAISWSLNSYNTTKKSFLVIASYFFYAFWKLAYVLVLFLSSTANYGLALLLGRLPDGPLRRVLFWFGVLGNLAVLGVFKYYDFFVAETINALARVGVRISLPFLEVGIPVAISFLTFHALSYIIDVYNRKIEPTKSWVDILFYISFFPHLVAGPIVRARDFLAQTVHVSRAADIRVGESVLLILGGLFKKVIVANYISTDFADPIFANPLAYSSVDLLLGMYAYAIQIYCDFSAYTDIAIGIACLLGYRFPQNFNQPYRALSVTDFWRRWHITLSSWLRDYLYIPLGGNRLGRVRTYVNLMVTMLLGGLWHGASWHFVLWGGLHGAALAVERLFGVRADKRPRRMPPWLAWLLTFHFVCITWVFFRSESWQSALAYLGNLFGSGTAGTTMTWWVALLMVIGAMTQFWPHQWFDKAATAYDRAPLAMKIAIPVAVIFVISVAAPGGVPPFIYFQF